jgi:SAM-dependent methyltransferase
VSAASILVGLEGHLRAFLAQGLIVDPWLAGLEKEFFEYDSQDQLADEAAQLAVDHWKEPLRTQTLDAFPAPIRMGRTAAHEILVSTSAAVAHERRGRIRVTPDFAAEAVSRVRRFIDERGFGALVRIYAVVTFVENHGAVRHYGAIAEEDFTRGLLHRPWVGYALDDELLAGIAGGVLAMEVRDGRRVVVQTAAGAAHYHEARQILDAAGYLERRLQLIYLSQFNLFADWDTQVAQMAPDALAGRRAFTAFAGIRAGMRLLEVGCGMATQTFEGGLWEAVGPGGSIVGADPAPGMLERAEAKAKQRHARNVSFRRAPAERMPMFRAGTFDAAVGTSFLHLTEAPRALVEMRRVTKPGGNLAVWSACQFSLDQPWCLEWFAPIIDLARQHGTRGLPPLLPGRFPVPGETARWFREAGLLNVETIAREVPWRLLDPDVSVAFLVHGVSLFQRELEMLPWKARQEVVEELKQRGRAVCADTTPETRTILSPTEFVKGTVPSA